MLASIARLLSWKAAPASGAPPAANEILLEDSTTLLLEDSTALLME